MADSVSEFFRMGGYAFYVWMAYGITLVILLANVWWSARSLKHSRRQARLRAGRKSS